MKDIYLITGVNEPYLPKAMDYIKSINRRSSIHNLVVTLDFTVPSDIQSEYRNVVFVPLSSDQVQAQNPNTCLQHGGFLPALNNISDDAIIIFTDADIDMQRDFSTEELAFFHSLKVTELAAGYNAYPEQTLLDEFDNLYPVVTKDDMAALFPGADHFRVFNTGVLAAQKRAYQSLYEHYVEYWEQIDNCVNHYAKQQWLLSYVMEKHFSVKLMCDKIHTHDHHPLSLRMTREYGHKFCVEDTPVVFSHHIPQYVDPKLMESQKKRINKKRLFWRRLAYSFMMLSFILVLVLIFALNG